MLVLVSIWPWDFFGDIASDAPKGNKIMFTTDQILNNIWIKRALFTATFSDDGAKVFAKHSKEFRDARSIFCNLHPRTLQALQNEVRAEMDRRPKKTVRELLNSPDTMILGW